MSKRQQPANRFIATKFDVADHPFDRGYFDAICGLGIHCEAEGEDDQDAYRDGYATACEETGCI